ncbi:MAG: hypothetical protein ACON4F_03290 [Candidatus Puniceispirillaceae bacterium]
MTEKSPIDNQKTEPKEPQTATELLVARRRRNHAILGVIFGLAALFYIITIVRMSLSD